MNPTTDVKFCCSQQHSSFNHDCMPIISLHLPTVNVHMMTEATTCVSTEGWSYKFLSQVWHRREQCKEKRLWYPRGWVHCGSASWVFYLRNKQCSDRENRSFGHDIFPTWAGRLASGFDFLFVEDVLVQCFEWGYDKMPVECQAQSLGSSHDKTILHGFKNISKLYFGKQP